MQELLQFDFSFWRRTTPDQAEMDHALHHRIRCHSPMTFVHADGCADMCNSSRADWAYTILLARGGIPVTSE
jgi:hypothetical protein